MEELTIETEFVEEETDVKEISETDLNEIVVFASDWTTETIVSQIKRNAIDINPLFQRRDAWDIKKKSKFIESLILGLPVPQIVLAELKKGICTVLDGKQRLLTLLQFFGLSDDSRKKFKLKGCDLRPDLDGKTIDDLENDSSISDLYNSLLNQTIRSVIIRNCKNPRILELIFIRLNTGSVQLSPHELRLARIPGNFMTFIDSESYNNSPLHTLLGCKGPDFRMRDSELLTRFFAFKYRLNSYNGELSIFLDESSQFFNDNWDSEEQEYRETIKNFTSGAQYLIEVFHDNASRKWNKDHFEKRFNRAIFDAFIFYFSNPEIVSQLKGKEDKLIDSYKKLCESSDVFIESVGVSTKKVVAVYNRIYLIGKMLVDNFNLEIKLPSFNNNLIEY